MNLDVEDVTQTAISWIENGDRVALATVVDTWRSSPRPVGSQLAVNEDGRIVGSVSGGCVEGAVIEASLELLAGADPSVLTFGVTNEQAWEVGLPCGGEVAILICRVEPAVLESIKAAVEQRAICCVCTRLSDGVSRVFLAQDVPDHLRPTWDALSAQLDEPAAAIVDVGEERTFIIQLRPRQRLVIIGAVHLAQVLSRLAAVAGYEVWVIDPRSVFADPQRFPNIKVVCEWPETALSERILDDRTAFVTLSHDPKLDEKALSIALASDCFYVGALGSLRNQRARKEHLRSVGTSAENLARIHGPVGLPIGARGTAEIAIAIMAEIIQNRRLQS